MVMRFFLCLIATLTLASFAYAQEGASFPDEEIPGDTVVVPANGDHPAHHRHVRKAPAKKPWLERSGVMVSVGAAEFWQKTSDGRTYDNHTRVSGRIGYSFTDLFDVYGEYGQSNDSADSGGNVSVKYRHDEYLIWIRKMFWATHMWAPYVAAGIGAQQETVTTTLASTSTRNTGELEALGSLAGGLRFGGLAQLSIEGRLSFSTGYNPNPEPLVGVQAGLRF